MTPQEFKNSILQLAIQGKLVAQRAEEGTGKELLEKILAAKNAKDAKGKGEKSAKVGSRVLREEIPDDEKPFDIPESWEWVRLGDISSVITKGTTPRGGNVSYSDKGVGFLRAENIAGLDVLDKSNLKYIDEKTHLGVLRRSVLEANDILITIAGTLGRTAIVRDDDLPLNANQAVSMIRLVDAKLVNLKYIIIALNSPVIQRLLTKQRKVTAIPNLTLEIIGDCIFPLPPLAEQKRIVAKIEELMPLVERYEKAWSKLKDFNKRFPADMQKSLLQMAIQGKLVEQRAEEGTGKELLEKILAAKNAKDAKGKGEKSHAKSAKSAKAGSRVSREEIPDDEKPFDIPESWEWVRLGEVGSWSAGATPSRTRPDYYSGNIPWLKTGDLNDGYVAEIPETITELALAKTSVRLNPVGSVLMAMYGATIGKLGILQVPATTNQACCACIPFSGIYNKYLFYFLKGYRKSFIKMGEGGAQPNISKEKIVRTLTPLPPLAEQKRIVAKLEELLPLCERLK